MAGFFQSRDMDCHLNSVGTYFSSVRIRRTALTFLHNRKLIVAATITVAVTLMAVYFFFDPESEVAPKCVFRQLTGWDCPGCGSQRAFHALLHGRIGEAWGYNPALFFMIPMAVMLGWVEIARSRHPKLHAAVYRPWTVLAVGIGIAGWTVVRNVCGL